MKYTLLSDHGQSPLRDKILMYDTYNFTIKGMFYEIILDSGETANKCTIAPLSYRSDFHLIRVKGAGALGPFQAPILLHPEGGCLTRIRDRFRQECGIASIDCVWRRLDTLIRRISGDLPMLARIPDGFETAYPRQSKIRNDPRGGLATIEAIFTAAALLGNWDASLLSDYYFGRKFVELNLKRFLDLGVPQVKIEFPVLKTKPKHSLQRRRDRGRIAMA